MEKVKVVLRRSLIGTNPKQRATAESLGLRKIGDSSLHANDAVFKGKITVISHLVSVETE